VSGAWLRRALTIPGLALALTLLCALAPVVFPLALSFDVIRWALSRRPFLRSRLLASAPVFLSAEMVGLVALWVVWFTAGLGASRSRRLIDATYAVQSAWASFLLEAARRFLSLRFVVEGDECARPGPVIVLIQHASLVDTLIPTAFITRRHGIRLRFVLKKELLISPCLDVAGLRLPNVFVDRSATQTDQEVARIRDLASDLDANQGVLIYPEGTIFSPEKRRRALARLGEGDADLFSRASTLVNVLPPRLGGPLALLDGAPQADCVFVAHRGLEGIAYYADLLEGHLVGREVRVRMWRVPRSDIPADREGRTRWLYEQWARLDAWVTATREAEARRPA